MSRYIDADILLEIIEGLTWYHPVQGGEMVEGANETGWYKSDDVFRAVEECVELKEQEEQEESEIINARRGEE